MVVGVEPRVLLDPTLGHGREAGQSLWEGNARGEAEEETRFPAITTFQLLLRKDQGTEVLAFAEDKGRGVGLGQDPNDREDAVTDAQRLAEHIRLRGVFLSPHLLGE